MEFMEIAILQSSALRIKGKRSSFVVDLTSTKSNSDTKAVILLTRSLNELNVSEDTVVINGPGEYEIGGVKMNASRLEGEMVYNPNVDGVEVILGKISSFEKMQHKLKEQHIVIAYVDTKINASFITSLASNVVIFYGEKAGEVVDSVGGKNFTKMPKYSTTIDKLPQEVETVILE